MTDPDGLAGSTPGNGPSPADDRSIVARTLLFLRLVGQPGRLALVVALSMLSSLAEAGVLLLVVAGASAMLSESGTSLAVGPFSDLDVDKSLIAALIATPVFVIARLLAARMIAGMTADVLHQARRMVIGSLLRSSWASQSTVTSPRLQELVSIQSLRMSGLLGMLATAVTALTSFIAMAVAAALIDVPTAVGLIVAGGVLGLMFRPITKVIRRRTIAHLEQTHDYLNLVDDLRGVLPELRIYGVAEAADDSHATSSAATAEAHRRMKLASMIAPALYMGVVLFLMVGGLLLLRNTGDIDVAAAAGIALVLLRGLRYSQSSQSSWHNAMELLPYVDDLVAVQDEWNAQPTKRGSRQLESVGRIELVSVGYTYPSGQVGLRDVDLTIEPGTVVGLAGPSGAGKTTLAQVLLGLREPTEGTLSVDGVSAEEFDEASWFSRFAYVAQNPILLAGNVADNVRFLRDIDDDAVSEALVRAAMTTDLAQWDGGDQRHVGTGGSEVSGGQRQRIAIARALAGRPDVVVLDEPTSALDPEAERAVRDTLERLRGELTVIMIAHRETTLEVCDVVVTMTNGRVDSIRDAARCPDVD